MAPLDQHTKSWELVSAADKFKFMSLLAAFALLACWHRADNCAASDKVAARACAAAYAWRMVMGS
jgi:hypothetical protein